MRSISATCRSCGTVVAVRMPPGTQPVTLRCPGCDAVLAPDTRQPEPSPQSDTSDSPAVQAVVKHFGQPS